MTDSKRSGNSSLRSKLWGIKPAVIQQKDLKKIYRAKHVLSPSARLRINSVEGKPNTQSKTFTYFSEPWRPLRLCARHVFPISSSSQNSKYLWLD